MIFRVSSVLALTCVAAWFVAADLHAECIGLSRARDARKAATLVFTGVVTKTDTAEGTVQFDVDRVWKGGVRRQYLMFVVPGEDMWDERSFEEGTAYLVFTSPLATIQKSVATPSTPAGTPVVRISLCGGTRRVDDAEDWIKQLGRPRAPARK